MWRRWRRRIAPGCIAGRTASRWGRAIAANDARARPFGAVAQWRPSVWCGPWCAREGLRIASGAARAIVERLDQLPVPAALADVIAPLRDGDLTQLNARLPRATRRLRTRARRDAIAQQLMTAPGVGPVVALTFQAVVDTPARFGGDAGRASAFLGLVPSEDSSAERRHQGLITKTGPGDLRALLVQASWGIWRGRSAAGAALRTWAHALAARRGRRIAIVALARRLTSHALCAVAGWPGFRGAGRPGVNHAPPVAEPRAGRRERGPLRGRT